MFKNFKSILNNNVIMSTIKRKFVVVYKKRIVQTKKIIIYKNKTIKKYLNYKKNYKTIFQIKNSKLFLQCNF